MISLLAHEGHGVAVLGIPTWLALYGSGIVVAIVAAALRALWPQPRLTGELRGQPPLGGDQPIRFLGSVGRIVGVLMLLLVISAALLGPDRRFSNLSPYVVWSLFPVTLTVLSLLLGDVWRTISPFETLSLLWRRPGRRDNHAPLEDRGYYRGLTDFGPALVMFLFFWLRYGYHEAGRPRLLGVSLIVYTIAMVAGSLLGGPAWLRHNDAFSLWFGRIASLSPIGRDLNGEVRFRRPFTGATRRGSAAETSVLLVIASALVFAAIDSSDFWFSVVGENQGWSLTFIRTMGMIWILAITTALFLGSEWLVGRVASQEDAPEGIDSNGEQAGDTAGRFIGLLAALLCGMTIAYGLVGYLLDVQRVAFFLTDPYNKRWDLIGTRDLKLNSEVLAPATGAWIELIIVLIAGSVAMLISHDITLDRFDRDTASRAGWMLTAAVALGSIGISVALLAG